MNYIKVLICKNRYILCVELNKRPKNSIYPTFCFVEQPLSTNFALQILNSMAYAGCSYEKRVIEVNQIYDEYARTGLSNREIWRRYIWPVYGISEKTFYNYINAAANPKVIQKQEVVQLNLFG